MKTTTKLALCSLKSEKTRSILSAIAIFLSTVLITIIAFGCNSIIQQQKNNAAENYGEHYGMFNMPTPEQIESIKIHAQFYNLGAEIYAAEGIFKGYNINLFEMDSAIRTLAHFKLESGNYPEKENELIAQKEFFALWGLKNPKIGDRVTLSIRINGTGEIIKKDFIISGFTVSSEANNLAKRYSAYVSQKFIQENIPNPKERSVYLAFKVRNDENLTSSQMKEKILSLAKELELKESQVNVNSNYLAFALEPDMGVVASGICIILIIIMISALVIYNIFHVAIIQKIREYGRLKALGARKRQLKKMIRMEGIVLSFATIPAGILFGCLILKFVFYYLNKEFIPVFSLPLAALVVLLALCTVFISLKKPIKMASKTSPIEAIRYEAGGKEHFRKGKEQINIFKLTMSNLALHKKRTAMTILTMGLSCILFVVIANVVGNMDAKQQVRNDIEFGKFRMELDYTLHDTTYPQNNLNEVQKLKLMDNTLIEKIKAIPGVTEVRTRKLMEVYAKNQNTGKESYVTVTILNEEDFEWLVNEAARGTVDYQNTAKKDGIIYMWDHFMDDEYQIGDTFQCEILDGDKRIPFSAPILGSCSHSNDGEMAITETTFQKLGIMEDMTNILFIDCKSDAQASVRSELETLISSTEYLSMSCFEDHLKLTNLSIQFTRSACYTFLIILSIIGFMNMANTMITNIITRKREFGIMQAIGMSNRQLNQMLQFEGLIFTSGTLLLSLILGNILGYFAFHKCLENGIIGLFQYHLPILELSFLVFGILLLQMILAYVLSRNIKKESLIERIRCEE